MKYWFLMSMSTDDVDVPWCRKQKAYARTQFIYFIFNTLNRLQNVPCGVKKKSDINFMMKNIVKRNTVYGEYLMWIFYRFYIAIMAIQNVSHYNIITFYQILLFISSYCSTITRLLGILVCWSGNKEGNSLVAFFPQLISRYLRLVWT